MLALRGWSAYELTQQLRRSLDYCWPTAESVWYGEPKRLVRLGLATARRESAATGRRARTLYAITGQGRQVLAAWLASEPDPPRLQIESMLRLRYADQGSKQDLLAAVRSIRRWVLAQAPAGLWHIRGYLDPEEENATQSPTGCTSLLFHLVLRQRVRTDDHLGGPG
jgi:PadR family transcriptional regulator, regulatory protein AphA